MLKLEVYHEGFVHEYNADLHIEEEDFTLGESATAGEVETADVELSIDGTFLGASSVFDLPAGDGAVTGSWRARVTAGDAIIIDGVIYRNGGVSHTPHNETWHVTVVQDALQVYRDRLEAIRLITGTRYGAADPSGYPEGQLDYTDVNPDILAIEPTLWQMPVKSVVPGEPDIQEAWVDMGLLWEEALSIMTGDTFVSPPVFWFDTRYMDGATEMTISRRALVGISARAGEILSAPLADPTEYGVSLPDMTALGILEAIQVMHAWRLRAEYDEFPNRTVTATAISDVWEAPVSPPDLTDAFEEGGEPEIAAAEAEYPDLGLQYQNDYADRRFLLYQTGELFDSNEYTPGPGDFTLVGPATSEMYAAKIAERFTVDGQPDNADLVQLPFHLTYISDVTFEVHPAIPLHPAYVEHVFYADSYWTPNESRGKAHLMGMYFHTDGFNRRLVSHNPQSTLAPGQAAAYNRVWPEFILETYDVSTRERYVMAATFDMEGAPFGSFAVGVASQGVRVFERDWIVRTLEFAPGTESASMELETPADL